MRRFLCLLLVLCLMASLLVIPASATAVTTATFDGLAAVAAMIAGTGVTINAVENFPVFNKLVTSVFDHLTAQNIIDGAGTISALLSGQKTYIPVSVIQSVKDWLFDSLTIGADGSISTVTTARLEFGSYYWELINMNTSARLLPVAWKNTFNNKYQKAVFLVGSFGINETNAGSQYSSFSVNDLHFTVYKYGSLGSEISAIPTGYSYIGEFETQYGVSSVGKYIYDLYASSPDMFWNTGLTFGNTAPISGTSVEENYPAWVESAILSPPITLPGGTEDDEAIQYIPVSIPSYSVSTPAIPPSQAEIWTGTDTSGSGSGSDGEAEEIPVVPDVAVGVAGLLTTVKLIADYLVEFKDAVIDWIDVKWTSFVSWLTETLTAIKERAIALADYMALIKDGLLEWIQVTWVNFVAWLTETLTAIKERAIELATYLATIATWLVDVLGVAVESILGVLSDILAWALGLVEALVAAFEALLVKIFVPDIASIQAAVADMRAQFPFFDAIIATGQYLVSGISSGEPPIIYIHLENAEGLYTWGNTVAVLDMSFYSRYKPAGDAIMSSALITFFAWRTLKHLPGILSGAASDSDVFKEI